MKELPRIFWIPIVCMIAICILSLINADVLDSISTANDKIKHFVAYFVLTFLWMYALNKSGKQNIISTALSIAILYGIIMECLQYGFFTGRHFEFLDIIANIIGSVTGAIFTKYFLKI